MRILVGGIYHETHSFSNVPTNRDSFRKVLLLEGREVLENLRETTSEMAGFIKAGERFGFELIPTVWAWGVSTGPVEAATLEHFLQSIQGTLERDGPVDGVLFALHGACISENDQDGDGYILSKLRAYAGNDIPIAVTLDFHANISERMVSTADVIVGYDTYPHVDQVETAVKAGELIVRTIRGEIKPVMALEKPPMLIVPQTQWTSAYPMSELLAIARRKESDVLSVSVSGGFAYSDVPEAGPAVVVVANNQPELAREVALEISKRMWEVRNDFLPRLSDVQTAVAMSVSSNKHPVILADVGDNIGAGTPGDGTVILRELFVQRAEGAVVTLADPEGVARALAAGIGETIKLAVGGKCDKFHGEPIEIEGTIKLISDGVFTNRGQMRDGVVERMGRTVVLDTNGSKIVLTEVKMPPWNLEQLRSVGISPENEKIIVVKSAVAFRAAYEPIAGLIIEVNSPGLSSADLTGFEFQHIRRPIFPLDNFPQDLQP